MRIVTLASRLGWHTGRLEAAARARGATMAFVPWEALVTHVGGRPALAGAGEDLEAADLVLARIIPNGSLEQIILRVDTLHRLEAAGRRVVNPPRAIERSVNKALATSLFAQAGLPTPETVVCEGFDDAMAAFRALGDVIVKPLFGSMGLGMVRVTSEEVAWRVFRAIEQVRGVYYLQRTVPHGGRDLRAFVVGDRVVGAIERRADGWKTNISRGGTAVPVTLPPAAAALAVRAARLLGAEYAGVDLLPADDGTLHVLEVNGIPGWQGLETATGLDVAGALLDHLLAA